MLIDNAALACIQFQKGYSEPTSLVSMLIPEVLSMIYSFVFPFPNMKTGQIVNPQCFPVATHNDIKQRSSANLFAHKIAGINFFRENTREDAKQDKIKTPMDKEKCIMM